MSDVSDIFISYSSEDAEIAAKVRDVLSDGRRVFFAPAILPGTEWNELVQTELRRARCVVVLWSANAKKSLWVHGEAAHAFERGCYVPVTIDNVEPPKLFMQVQTPSIASWIRQQDTRPIVMLKGAIASLIDRRRGYEILESVKPEEPVEARHLNLIHEVAGVRRQQDDCAEIRPHAAYQIHR